jgi:cytidylate kinase
LAIVTISHQHGSRGEAIAAEVAARLGFQLVTPEKVDEVIHERYRLDLSLSGEIDQLPREIQASKIFASLISGILTDMALLQDLVVLECGGQFIFRSFPNSIHVRIVAPRDVRVHHVMEARQGTFDEALAAIDEHERKHLRFLRSTFRRPSETPERYDLVINTGGFEVSEAIDLILHAVNLKKLPQYGLVSSETVQRAKLRNQIRLARALSRLAVPRAEPARQFAHPSERVFASLLDFYGIRWEYEPTTFPLERDASGHVTEAFSPDFYLLDSQLYVELTTMKQSLVTKKNRKVKRLRELYPDVKIRLLYQKDFEDLIFKYTSAPAPEIR